LIQRGFGGFKRCVSMSHFNELAAIAKNLIPRGLG